MTDQEMFARIRDLIVARTGAWSSNQVLRIAAELGYARRRPVAIQAIRGAIGDGNRGAGRPPKIGSRDELEIGSRGDDKSVPELVPDVSEIGSLIGSRGDDKSVPESVPEKEKKEPKKRKSPSYNPHGAKAPSPPNVPNPLAAIEADVQRYVAFLASLNASGRMTSSREGGVRASIVEAVERVGAPQTVHALRASVSKPARNHAYFEAIVEAPEPRFHGRPEIGSRIGSGPVELPFFLRPENNTDYAAVIAARKAKSASHN